MTSFRKVSDIKLDIEKSVKREGTFDVVRKQAFAIVNSDGFLDELQRRVAVDIRNMVRCNPERLSKEDLRSMIRHHLRTKYVPEISEKVNSSVDREWLKSQLADNVKEKVVLKFCRAVYGILYCLAISMICVVSLNGGNHDFCNSIFGSLIEASF
ncbi:unnamed protein product [Cylicostephanus goldi]|uniref:BOD1/SHG1 domain-containing protein n=1 Tax=Cylicostephanus goldi TaxID=71465 RepID=A0A3P7NAZ1_CYLGO|nr:unnamed protein product [Cylicostephanus goldi]